MAGIGARSVRRVAVIEGVELSRVYMEPIRIKNSSELLRALRIAPPQAAIAI